MMLPLKAIYWTKVKLPVCKIKNPPYNHSYYTGPATINIEAKVTTPEAGVTISKVEFFNGNTLLFTDFTSPYSYTWSNVPLGEYSLTAKATDNNGAVTTSSLVEVSVLENKPPVINITSPV